jgi:hypothetical protein
MHKTIEIIAFVILFPISAIMGIISCKGNRNAPPPYPPCLSKPKKHKKKNK